MKNNWKQLIGILAQTEDEVPEGWKTRFAVEKELGLSAAATSVRIRKAIDMGRIEVKKFRVRARSGTLRPTEHYRLIEK